MSDTILRGRVFVFGPHIDTDLLAPGAYMKSPIETLALHCLEAIAPDFARSVRPGDFILAGSGFGMGSSREQAAQALKVLGIRCVLASSFARIFYRNAINLGLAALEFDAPEFAATGDELEIDLAAGHVSNLTRGTRAVASPMPEFLRAILADGGLMPHLAKRLKSQELS
jgi:3-isopropylmalate/(R)-2-methylmalate dehydratase small subunit